MPVGEADDAEICFRRAIEINPVIYLKDNTSLVLIDTLYEELALRGAGASERLMKSSAYF